MSGASRTATASRKPRPTRSLSSLILIGIFALASAIALSLFLGSRPVDPLTALLSQGGVDQSVLTQLRLPRIIAGVVAGAALASAGLLSQTVLNNHLADPGLIGVNAGAILGGLLVVQLMPHSHLSTVVACIGGALVAAVTLLTISGRAQARMGSISMVITGMAISALLGGLASLVALSDPLKYVMLRSWLVGSLAGRPWELVQYTIPFVVLALGGALLLSRSLDALSLGTEKATTLGLNGSRVTAASIAIIAVLAGSSVALAGPLVFIGLAVPHIARQLARRSHGSSLLLAALIGGIIVVVADGLSRTVIAPAELPVAVLVAVVGAPLFVLYVGFSPQRKTGFRVNHGL